MYKSSGKGKGSLFNIQENIQNNKNGQSWRTNAALCTAGTMTLRVSDSELSVSKVQTVQGPQFSVYQMHS